MISMGLGTTLPSNALRCNLAVSPKMNQSDLLSPCSGLSTVMGRRAADKCVFLMRTKTILDGHRVNSFAIVPKYEESACLCQCS